MTSRFEQTRWLTESVGVYVTRDRIVRVSGDDALSWLNGQVTADVRVLPEGRAVYALATTIKGRVLTDLWVVQAPATALSMVLPERSAEAALSSFDKHIIMEDVELTSDNELVVVSAQGPRAAQLFAQRFPASTPYACDRLPTANSHGYDLWVTRAELSETLQKLTDEAVKLGGGMVDDDGWETAHVMLAVPRAGVDFGSDTYPQEAGLKGRAVSFSKGCYLGQEVVYMLENRGQLARRLVQLEHVPATAQRADVVCAPDGGRVGELTSVVRSEQDDGAYALAYVKRSYAEIGASVRVNNQTSRVRWVVGASDAVCPIVAST